MNDSFVTPTVPIASQNLGTPPLRSVHPIAAVQSEYSLWTRDPEDELIPTSRELGIALVACSLLGRDFLPGGFGRLDELSPDDWRRNNPRFQLDRSPL